MTDRYHSYGVSEANSLSDDIQRPRHRVYLTFLSGVLCLVIMLFTTVYCAAQMNHLWAVYALFLQKGVYSCIKLEQIDMMLTSSLVLRLATVWFSFGTLGPKVKFGNTTLVGAAMPDLGVEFYGGIPFAEPPLGRLRLQPPVLKVTLEGSTFDAANFGVACMQPNVPPNGISEDCLTINVFRPADIPSNASLPVMAWIYGGGFIGGAASIYNGSAIVAQSIERGTPIIYVNFNYRLGPLGFPQGHEAASRGALNLGLKDQLTALEWVQQNIWAFGGDKDKVTVFGESAGAVSLSVLYLNPDFNKLARAAIFQSGSAATTLTYHAERRQMVWESFVAGVASCEDKAKSADTFHCLRAASSSELLEGFVYSLSVAPELFPYPPTLDGPGGVYPELPSQILAKGNFSRLPFIAGTTLDEGTLFVPTTINSSQTIYEWLIGNFTPSLEAPDALETAAQTLLELYPDDPVLGSPFGTGNETFGLSSQFKRISAMMDDVYFQSQRRYFTQAASRAGSTAFGYLFTDPQPSLPPYVGVEHSSDVKYVYGAINDPPSSQKLSENMIDYWVSFATSQNPNDGLGTPRPEWALYTPENQVLMQLDGTNLTLIRDTYRAPQISFINSDPLLFHH